MTYQRFEDLPVWNEAIRPAEGCEDFLITAKDCITFSKRDQLDRCSLSVSNNIAEGFERGTTNELLAFLYIACGSAGEVRSMLGFFERRPALPNFKSQISNLKSTAESCSRQIRVGPTPSKTPISKASATSPKNHGDRPTPKNMPKQPGNASTPASPTATRPRKI